MDKHDAVEQVLGLVSEGGGQKDFGIKLAGRLSRADKHRLLVFVSKGTDEQMDAAELTVLLLIVGGDGDLLAAVKEQASS